VFAARARGFGAGHGSGAAGGRAGRRLRGREGFLAVGKRDAEEPREHRVSHGSGEPLPGCERASAVTAGTAWFGGTTASSTSVPAAPPGA